MFPENNLSDKLFQVGNPRWTLKRFIEFCAVEGIAIDQTKTVSDFMVPLNGILVGQTSVNFTANAPFSSSTTALQYPQSEHFVITAIRGLAGANATLAATAWVAGWSDALSINGYFTINNNGTNVIQNTRFTVFQPGSNSPDAGWLYLSKPIILVGQTNLTVTGSWTTAPTTANQNGSIELHGLKLI